MRALDRAVAQAISTNETAISSVEVLSAARQVDDKAQAIARMKRRVMKTESPGLTTTPIIAFIRAPGAADWHNPSPWMR